MRRLAIVLFVLACLSPTAASSRIASIPTVERAIDDAELLVYGQAVEAATASRPNAQGWLANVHRLEVEFRIEHVLKGEMPEENPVKVVLPILGTGDRIFDGPEYESLEEGEYAVLALVPFEGQDSWRPASREWTHDTNGYAFTAVERTSFQQIPDASPAWKIAHALVSTLEKGPETRAQEALREIRWEMTSGEAFSHPAIRDYLQEKMTFAFHAHFRFSEYEETLRDLSALVLCHLGDPVAATHTLFRIRHSEPPLSNGAVLAVNHLIAQTNPPWLCEAVFETQQKLTGYNRQMLLVNLARYCPSERVKQAVIEAAGEPDAQYSVMQILHQNNLDLNDTDRQQIRDHALEVFRTAENVSWRASAARTVARVGDATLIPVFAEVLSATHEFDFDVEATPPTAIRMAAVNAVAELGGQEAIPILIRALDVPDWQVQRTAIGHLSDLTGRELDYNIHVSGDPALEKRAVQDWRDWWAARQQAAGE